MTTRLLAATALIALTATSALAQSRTSTPPRPIPYAQLDAYLAASPQERRTRDWWAGESAQTGTPAPVSATAPMTIDDVVPGPEGTTSATSGQSNSQIGQGEAGEATSSGTTTPE